MRTRPRARSALYRRHRDFVLRVARRSRVTVSSRSTRCRRAFTYLLNKFPPAGDGLTLTARLLTLLYPAAKNAAITAVRKARQGCRRRRRFARRASGGGAADAEPIDAALVALSPERREVLTLQFVDDLSLAEIAVALDVPLGTVKSLLRHAGAPRGQQNQDLFDS
jgi:hypothetical protein